MRNMERVFVLFVLNLSVYLVTCQKNPNLEWKYDPFSTDQWFKQKLDHYDSSNVQYWPQRYVTSYRYYRLGGPIFLFLSGPGPEISVNDIETGAIAAYAEEQGAFVIGLEHRFYGKSRPTSDLSTGNLHYLTIPQSIEDIAAFIRAWRGRDEFRNCKWALFGSSYLGSLTTWFAQKHPEMIDVFVASSAPLELRYEIPEFLENVGHILNQTDPRCYDVVADSFSCLTRIFNDQGCETYSLDDLKNKFDFCADLDPSRPLDATGVIAELFSTVNAVVMYHDPDPESFPDTNLDRFCKHITRESGKTSLEKIAEKVKEINKHRGISCAEFRFESTVEFLDNKEWDSPAAKQGHRQLQWQLCNELGWTVASANISQPFGNYLNPFLHAEVCQKLFGLSETEMRLKVLKANTDLGGKSINTKCGIFVNGDSDPWHTFGITSPMEAGRCNRAVIIEGGSHARDVEDFTFTPSHPPQVRKAQLKIATYLDSWLRTGKCCEEEYSESRRVITRLTRPKRSLNPREYYAAMSDMLRRPKVEIRPHAYPAGVQVEGERMIASPTSVPYQLSTTDVLSVSPRIPVVMQDAMKNNNDQMELNSDIYRDPRNAEYRKYRIVKFLRHRDPSVLTTPRSNVPSMEQFEADFPEHSIRVEGRVERVFKNGTKIETSTESSALDNDQKELFDRGRKLLIQTASPSPNEVNESEPVEDDSDEDPQKRSHFRYVVKHVFKDVVDPHASNSENSESEYENENAEKQLQQRPRITAKSQQNANADIYRLPRKNTSDSEGNEDAKYRTTYSVRVSTSDEPSNEVVVQKGFKVSQKKRASEEKNSQNDDNDYDSDSESESLDHSSTKRSYRAKTNSSGVIIKVTSKDIIPGKTTQTDDEDDIYDDEYPDSYYDDEDYYSDEDDGHNKDNEKGHKEAKQLKNDEKRSSVRRISSSTSSKTKQLKKAKTSSTEFTSGEDPRPKRLREKISDKIMSSAEEIEGDQKSKVKSKNSRHKGHALESDEKENLSEFNRPKTDNIYSNEDYDYSLEPSGSDPQKAYRKSKKQLEPLPKGIIEEPETIINVEISGSYPRRKKKSKKITTTPEPQESSESNEDTVTDEEKVSVTERPSNKTLRKKSHRRKKQKPSSTTTTEAPTTNTTIKSMTHTPTSTPTTPIPVVQFKDQDNPPTNNYATWNKGRNPDEERWKPVQRDSPAIVPVDTVQPGGIPPNNNADVMYIIIGDIPKENNDKENAIVSDNPDHAALFNFIQKLVNRHSSGLFTNQPNGYRPAPIPPAPRTTTTTTTTTEAPPPPPVEYGNGGYNSAQVGKYLLVRPVHVVSIGKEHVVHANDLKNDTLLDLMTVENPYRQYTYQTQLQNMRRRHPDSTNGEGYRFKSPQHRDHFERLLSVDDQVRDSDRNPGVVEPRPQNVNNFRSLDEIPDPSWRSIRGISQFGPAVPPTQGNPTAGLLGLSTADTMWVNEGVPFLPRQAGRQFFKRGVQK